MDTTQPTPGPWHVTQSPEWDDDGTALDQLAVHSQEGVKVAKVETWLRHAREESEANARLIAAAPKLLVACDLVQRAWVGDGVDMASAVDACLLAIAHAEGRP